MRMSKEKRIIIFEDRQFLFRCYWNYPCDENRGKIDDLIAIYGPINCALYRDEIDQFDEF
jgi:hypothetical protein